MKRIFLIALLLTISVFTAAIFVKHSNQVTADNHNEHKQHNTQGSISVKVDGVLNPELVPNSAVYEIILKLMSSSDINKAHPSVKATFSRAAGFNAAEEAAITNAGFEYRRRINSLDQHVDEIKNAHWPDPNRQIMDRLAQLQREKEDIIADIIVRLHQQLSNYDATKMSKYIDEVKKKIKGFGVQLPKRKVGLFNKLSDILTASAQAPGCDANIYIYADAVENMNDLYVVGIGDYSVPYNNCGHTFNATTEIWGPQGTYATTAWGSAIINLRTYSGSLLDGNFLSTTSVEGFCSVISQSFSNGSNSGGWGVNPYFKLISFGNWNSATISPLTSPKSIQVMYEASISASGGTVNLEPGAVIQNGNITLGGISTNPSSGSYMIGGILTLEYTIIPDSGTGVISAAIAASAGSVRVLEPTSINSGSTTIQVIP